MISCNLLIEKLKNNKKRHNNVDFFLDNITYFFDKLSYSFCFLLAFFGSLILTFYLLLEPSLYLILAGLFGIPFSFSMLVFSIFNFNKSMNLHFLENRKDNIYFGISMFPFFCKYCLFRLFNIITMKKNAFHIYPFYSHFLYLLFKAIPFKQVCSDLILQNSYIISNHIATYVYSQYKTFSYNDLLLVDNLYKLKLYALTLNRDKSFKTNLKEIKTKKLNEELAKKLNGFN